MNALGCLLIFVLLATAVGLFVALIHGLIDYARPSSVERRRPHDQGHVVLTGSAAKVLCLREKCSLRDRRMATVIRPQLEVMEKMGFALADLIVVNFKGDYQVLPTPCHNRVI